MISLLQNLVAFDSQVEFYEVWAPITHEHYTLLKKGSLQNWKMKSTKPVPKLEQLSLDLRNFKGREPPIGRGFQNLISKALYQEHNNSCSNGQWKVAFHTTQWNEQLQNYFKATTNICMVSNKDNEVRNFKSSLILRTL